MKKEKPKLTFFFENPNPPKEIEKMLKRIILEKIVHFERMRRMSNRIVEHEIGIGGKK